VGLHCLKMRCKKCGPVLSLIQHSGPACSKEGCVCHTQKTKYRPQILLTAKAGLDYMKRIGFLSFGHWMAAIVPISDEALRKRTKSGSLTENTRAIFGRSYAAEPDILIEQLRKDEAIAEADTLLLTIPNQLAMASHREVVPLEPGVWFPEKLHEFPRCCPHGSNSHVLHNTTGRTTE
jgi:hypothetical protein